MLDRTDDISIAAENWLAQFETALAEPDDGLLKALFHPDSHWRDVLALSWSLQTINGAEAIGDKQGTVTVSTGLRETNPGPVVFKTWNSARNRRGMPCIIGSTHLRSCCARMQF